jgi:hypothetical protein
LYFNHSLNRGESSGISTHSIRYIRVTGSARYVSPVSYDSFDLNSLLSLFYPIFFTLFTLFSFYFISPINYILSLNVTTNFLLLVFTLFKVLLLNLT